ncbi:YigZ family protein [Alloscardovia omnicolens]|uniref:IMPACT family protein n=1 Tax=Alloscardovia omnicolens TaxID=419015 RepID=UPI003A62594B
MLTVTNPPSQCAHYSYIEKKSEFIGDACHISTLDEAVDFVESIRAQHPKARHVCFAAVTGASQAQFHERMSDDGEPSGTAGKPILNVLRQSGTTDTVIAVTRYFGGILLGAGGLVRAYSTAAAEVLRVANTGSVIPAQEYMCTVDYAQHSMMQRIIQQHKGRVVNEEFTDKVNLRFLIPCDVLQEVEDTIQHTFNGLVLPVRGELGSLME